VLFGRSNVDMCTYCGPRFPIPGETILGTEYKQGFGGKGSNQAVMAAKLSPAGTVAMVGCVGTDLHGDGFRKAMVDAGIDVTLLASAPDGVATGTAAILIGESNQVAQALAIWLVMEAQVPLFTREELLGSNFWRRCVWRKLCSCSTGCQHASYGGRRDERGCRSQDHIGQGRSHPE
jgi:hypothetical protein